MNRILSSGSITGTNVRNMEGQDLGNIKELMINTSTGEIEYAVLAFGGLLGIGDKYFAIPWKSFSLDTSDEEFILNISKEELKKTPGFDKGNWPTTNVDAYLVSVNNYYNTFA